MSQMFSGVVGRSAHFTHHHNVDHENGHRHGAKDYDSNNAAEDIITKIQTDVCGCCGYRHNQCQTDNYLLRSGCCTPRFCLQTII